MQIAGTIVGALPTELFVLRQLSRPSSNPLYIHVQGGMAEFKFPIHTCTRWNEGEGQDN